MQLRLQAAETIERAAAADAAATTSWRDTKRAYPRIWAKVAQKYSETEGPGATNAAIAIEVEERATRKQHKAESAAATKRKYALQGEAEEMQSRTITLYTSNGYGASRARIYAYFGRLLGAPPTKVENERVSVMPNGANDDGTDQHVWRVRLRTECFDLPAMQQVLADKFSTISVTR